MQRSLMVSFYTDTIPLYTVRISLYYTLQHFQKSYNHQVCLAELNRLESLYRAQTCSIVSHTQILYEKLGKFSTGANRCTCTDTHT